VEWSLLVLILGLAAGFYSAVNIGANDVANAVGPVAAIVYIFQTRRVEMNIPVPVWLLFLGGIGIAFGTFVWGHGVMETVGKKITSITPTRCFAAEFGTAATVLLCSRLGMPVSTTHVCVGNVIGVGLARGIAAMDLGVIRRIFSAWVISLPASAFSPLPFISCSSRFFLEAEAMCHEGFRAAREMINEEAGVGKGYRAHCLFLQSFKFSYGDGAEHLHFCHPAQRGDASTFSASGMNPLDEAPPPVFRLPHDIDICP